jgi:hypothetical protein
LRKCPDKSAKRCGIIAEVKSIFTASCRQLETNGRQIRFKMTHGGILAWDTEPEDYPKVYLLEMVQ